MTTKMMKMRGHAKKKKENNDDVEIYINYKILKKYGEEKNNDKNKKNNEE